jgi:hypothetical protein
MSSTSPKSSPGNTGIVHFLMLLGEVAHKWRGDIKKIRRLVMSIAGVRQKYEYLEEYHTHGDAQFLLVAASLAKFG